jgi:GcrA cell cycle regulator
MIGFWTIAREEQLEKLAGEGLSCREIAVEMNCFSHCSDGGRSAVIGKVHRMKLPLSHHAAEKPKRERFAAVPHVTSAGRIRNVTRLQAKANGHDPGLPPQCRNPSHNVLAAIAIAAAAPGLSEKLKGAVPDGTGIKLHELTKLTCRWPIGDPKTPEFEFCGDRVFPDLPYCAGHARLAYQPPYQRDRADQALGVLK